MTSDYYVEIINKLLTERKEKNNNYSLRALARDMDVDPGYLVHILKKNKPMTPKIAFKIGSRMNLQGEKMLEFLLPSLRDFCS